MTAETTSPSAPDPSSLTSCLEAYPRRARFGANEGYADAWYIVLFVQPFSEGEDELLAWAAEVDGSRLLWVLVLDEKRDLFVLRRDHTRQARRAALAEQRAHLARLSASLKAT